MEVDKLNEICNLFDLTNWIKTETCCTKNHKCTIDLFLTNKPLSFQKTRVTETGISDYHKLISTFLKTRYTRLKLKIIYYRNYKNFNEEIFLKDLDLENSNLQQTLTVRRITILISHKQLSKDVPVKKEDSQRKSCAFYWSTENFLPYHMKSLESLTIFKTLIEN